MWLSNGVPLSLMTRKTMSKIGNGNVNVQITKDQLYNCENC